VVGTDCQARLFPAPCSAPSLVAGDVEGGLGVHEQGNNETVQTQDFGENENQNHADEETGLLSSTTDTGVTDDTNGEASSKTSKTDRETSTELNETSVQGEFLLETVGNQDGDDQTVNTNDTSHNDRNNVLDDKVRAENTHGGNADTRLGGTVGGAEAGEDNSRGAAHGTEEGGVNGAVLGDHLGGCEAALLPRNRDSANEFDARTRGKLRRR
jgi:hypothetical protein